MILSPFLIKKKGLISDSHRKQDECAVSIGGMMRLPKDKCHWPPLAAVHLDRFVPRDDAKRRGCNAQRVSLTLFAITQSDDKGCSPLAV